MEKTLIQKAEQIKEFKATFGNYAIEVRTGNVLKSMTLEEILSTDFEEHLTDQLEFYGSYNKHDSPEKKFMSVITSSSISNFLRALTPKNRQKVYDKFLDKQEVTKTRGIRGTSVVEEEADYIEFLEKVIDRGLLSNYKYDDSFVTEAADRTMTYGTLEQIDKIREAFKTSDYYSKTYTNYPLVIINANLNKDERIDIIKKNYRKKDLNKYTTFIRENLKDFNDLDDFIEATIIQNNRVSKKKEGILELIKRIFIGMRGDWFYINDTVQKCENKKDFVDKYRDYFTTNEVKTIIGSLPYSLERNAVDFFKILFNEQPFKYKMQVALGNNSLGNSIFSNLTTMPEEIIGDDYQERLYYTYKLKYSDIQTLLNNDFDTTMIYFKKFPDLFSEKFVEYFNLDLNDDGYYRRERFKDNYDLILETLLALGEENIKDLTVIPDEYFEKLGFVSTDSYWNAGEKLAGKVANFTGNILHKLFKDLIEKTETYKDFLYARYFVKLEDEDIMNDFVTDTSKLLNAKNYGPGFVKALRASNMSNALQTVFGKMEEFFTENYPEKELIIENMEQARDELIIICIL